MESKTAADVTEADKNNFDSQIENVTNATDAYVVSCSDVWAVVTCMGEYDQVLSVAVSMPGVVVHKADRGKGKISLAMEKYADEL